MTPEQKREAAFEDLEEFLLKGIPVEDAIKRAAEGNDLRPEIFHAVAEKILGDLRAYRERLLSNAERERFFIIIKTEVQKCRERTGEYSGVGFLWQRAIELLEENVEGSLGRRLTDIETKKIREAWSNQLKLKLQAVLAR